ncbi:MAG: haloacid dehalogenase type II [Acetobacteraceae bacterium]|nr:haloacid dehalogenase type II [Acetobacteraceae bacterium]
MKLTDFRVLSFDCYGTLIDWESGILTALRPLVHRAGLTLDGEAILAAFAQQETEQQAATPAMPYAALLTEVHSRLARLWKVDDNAAENERFGASIGDWPGFPDTVEALRALAQSYRLVILSNVDRDSFRVTNTRLGVTFDAIYTAQDIGSYKPDPRNFAWLLDRLAESGFQKSDVLHVAQSLYHDHAPANALGLASAWIDRRHGATGWGATVPPPQGVRYDFCFNSLRELADAVMSGV